MDPVGTRPVDELTLRELYSGERGQGVRILGAGTAIPFSCCIQKNRGFRSEAQRKLLSLVCDLLPIYNIYDYTIFVAQIVSKPLS